MDSDFLGKVKTLLADPESLERITAIARGLSAPTPAATPAAAPASAAESPAAGYRAAGKPDRSNTRIGSSRSGSRGRRNFCASAEPRLAADAARSS